MSILKDNFITMGLISYYFYYVCLGAALILSIWCVGEYAKNSDITEVSYRKFDSSNYETQYPSLSLCFMDAYKENDLQKYDAEGRINSSMYSEFLRGQHWNEKMLKVDYDLVTFDVKDYIIGTCITTIESTDCRNLTDIDHVAYVNPFGVFKCFSFHHKTESPLDEVLVAIKNSIFPGGIRPSSGRFLLLFHYPHQIARSLSTMHYNWRQRRNDTNDYHVLNFDITGIEVMNRRMDGNKQCDASSNYDTNINEQIMTTVGCQPPYWKSKYKYNRCNSKKKLRDIIKQHYMKQQQGAKFQSYIPPCTEMKTIDVHSSELSGRESENTYNDHILEIFKKKSGPNNNDWFVIDTHFWRTSDFKEIRQIKAYSFQATIGNAGGYIGLLVGITISELPMFLTKTYVIAKRFFVRQKKILEGNTVRPFQK